MQKSVIRELSTSDKDLIRDFIANNKVTVFQPASAGSNEACRATNMLVAERRAEFRAAARAAKKGTKK